MPDLSAVYPRRQPEVRLQVLFVLADSSTAANATGLDRPAHETGLKIGRREPGEVYLGPETTGFSRRRADYENSGTEGFLRGGFSVK